MRGPLDSRAIRLLPLALVPVPPALIAWAVAREAVNVPFADEWLLLPYVERALAGTLGLGDLWAPHYDHRMALPKLVILTLARLTAWDLRWELVANFAVALATFGVLAVLVFRTGARLAPAVRNWLLLGVSLLVFAPAQFQNWFWGIQVSFFMAALAAVLTVWCIARLGPSWSGALLAMLTAAAAALSLVSGLALFAIVPIGVLLDARAGPGRRPVIVAIVTAVIGAAFAVVYLLGLERSTSWAAFDPVQYVLFFLAYLGAPLGMAFGVWSAVWGVAGLAALAVSAMQSWRRPHERAATLPWLLLALYPIATAAMTAVGRLALGIDLAVSYRYTTLSGLFWVSVFVVAALAITSVHDEATTEPARARVWLAAGAVGIALAAPSYAFSSVEGQKWLTRATEQFAWSEECIRLYRVASDDCLRVLSPIWDPALREKIARLEALELGPFASLVPEPPLTAYTRAQPSAPAGWIDSVVLEYREERPFQYVISGWSVDVTAGGAAPAVLAVVDGLVVGRAATGGPRPDVAKALGDERLRRSGWTFRLGAFVLPAGSHAFEAYAVLSDRRIAPVAGAFEIEMKRAPSAR